MHALFGSYQKTLNVEPCIIPYFIFKKLYYYEWDIKIKTVKSDVSELII